MANFPTNPSIGDLFETKHDTFKWNGSGWEALGRILTHRQKSGTPYSSLSIKESGGVLYTNDTNTVLLVGEETQTGQVKTAHSSDANTKLLVGETVETGLTAHSSDANTKLLTGKTTLPGVGAHTADVATSLLMNSNFDSSNYNHPVTISGDAKLVKGYYFDGNEDYLEIPDSTDFNFGTDPFTIEFWFNTSATNSFDRFITFGSLAAGRYWTVAYQPSGQKWEFVVYNGGSWSATGRLLQADASDLTANTWHHLAMVRESGESDPKLYINGIEKTFTAHSNSQAMPTLDFAGYSGSVLKVGAWASGDSVDGYINDLRISKGIARYTANFTTEITAIDANHKLVLDGKATDSSDSARAITFNGNAHEVSKLGETSWKFDGTTDYLEVPAHADFDFGTGDFTIELWVNTTSKGNYDRFVGGGTQANGANHLWFFGKWPGSKLNFGYYNGSSYTEANFDVGTWNDDTWYHVALVRSGADVRFYWDGVLKGTWAMGAGVAINTGAQGLIVGHRWDNGVVIEPFNGYMDDLRISKGLARYTTNFTPHTVPHTTDIATKLLLQGGPDSSSLHLPTFSGDAEIVSAGYSFDGTGDYLSAADHADWNLGSGDFTIEFWAYWNSLSGGSGFMGQTHGGSAEQGWYFYRHNSGIIDDGFIFRWRNTAGARVGYEWSEAELGLVTDVWYHVALVRNGTSLKLYLDGKEKAIRVTEVAIGSTTLRDADGVLTIGQDANGYQHNGYMDGIRVSNTARYTADFTAEITAIDANHKLVLDGATTDSSDSAHSITFAGNANTLTKTAGYSMSFDGSDDWIEIPQSDDFAFTGDFTIEFWAWKSADGDDGYDVVLGTSGAAAGGSTGWIVEWSNSRGLWFYDCPNSAGILSFNTNPLDSTWHHIAIVRNSGTIKLYIDGVEKDSAAYSATLAAGNPLRVGAAGNGDGYGPAGNGDCPFNGYVNDLRITKGTARYTSNFYITDTTAMSDESSSSHSITAVGNVALSTAQKKFGTHSIYIPADNDYVAVTDHSDLQFGSSGDFTVECWFKVPNITAYAQYLWIKHDSGAFAKFAMQIQIDGTLRLLVANSSDNAYLALAATSGHSAVDDDEWHHCALTRASGTTKIWVDGTERMSITDAYDPSFAGHNFNIGGTPVNAFTGLTSGYVDDFRISNTARYSSNFIIDAGTYLVDKSSNSHSLTTVGNAAISTTQKKFGTHSLYFDGSGDYISLADHADFNFSGDFTIEAWVYCTDWNSDRVIICAADDSSGFYRLFWNDNGSGYWQWSTTNSSFTFDDPGLSTNTWYHVAIVRESGVLKLFRDGQQKGSNESDSTSYNPDSGLRIGRNWGTGGDYWSGYIDDLRISDTARYTSNFFLEDTTTPTDKKGTHTLTLNGDALITSSGSSEETKFGTGAMKFDGVGDDVTIGSDIEDFEFGSGDFTVETWYKTSAGGGQWANPIVAYGTNAGSTSSWKIYGGEYLWGYIWNGNTEYHVTATTATNDNEWHHVALCREGNTMRLFIDGALEDTVDVTGISPNDASEATFYIGTDGAGTRYTGCIDELRVTKGQARYTAAFTPQSAEHDLIDTNGWGSPVLGSGERALFVNKNGFIMKSSDGTVTKMDSGSNAYAPGRLTEGDAPGAYSQDTNTLLLLHFEGDNNSQVFTDSSSHGHTVEARLESGTATDVKLVTNASKFGSSSAYFDGSSEALRVAPSSQFDFGTGDFTIETWYKQPSDGGEDYMFVWGASASGQDFISSYISGGGVLFGYFNGSAWTGTVTTSGHSDITDNEWHHIAYVRSSGTMTIYIDGIARGNVACTTNVTTVASGKPMYIGGHYAGGKMGPAWFDEFRVSDTARYTGNFTPPTTAFAGTIYKPNLYVKAGQDSHTKLLFVGDSLTCGVGKTIATTEQISVDTSVKHFGDSSLNFSQGNTDYVKLDDHEDFHIGTSDFTLETWIRGKSGNSDGVNPIFYMNDGTPGNRFQAYTQGGKFSFFYNESGTTQIGMSTPDSSYADETWYHYVLTRVSGTWKVYVNGVNQTLTYWAGNATSAPNIQNFPDIESPYLGYSKNITWGQPSYWAHCNMQNYRFSKIARYTENFTPSTESFDAGLGGLYYRDPSGVETKIS